MRKLADLQADRASKLTKQEELVKNTAERNLNEEETRQFDELQNEINDLDNQIRMAKIQKENEIRMASLAGTPVDEPKKTEKRESFSFVRAINNVVNKRQLSSIEQELKEAANDELRSSGLSFEGDFAIPSTMFRAQTVTGDSGTKGGALVATDISVVQPLEPKLTIQDLGANIMSGLSGNVTLPSSGSFSLSYVAETADVAGIDTTFSGPTLKPKRLAGVVNISKQLLMQGSIDVENYIRQRLENAVNVAVLKGALNGAGGVAPTGLYSLITTNINTTAGAPTWPTIVNLESLIKSSDATEQSLAYLSDPMLRGVMKSTAKDAGSGLFLADGNTLNGYKYIASSVVPTLDSGASHPLVFGDWSQMFAGFWGGMSFTIDPYTLASSSQIRIIVEIFNDVAVTNEKAFAINKVMTV